MPLARPENIWYKIWSPEIRAEDAIDFVAGEYPALNRIRDYCMPRTSRALVKLNSERSRFTFPRTLERFENWMARFQAGTGGALRPISHV